MFSASLSPHAHGWGAQVVGSPPDMQALGLVSQLCQGGLQALQPGMLSGTSPGSIRCPLVSSTEPSWGCVSAVRCCAFSPPPPSGALRCLMELEMVPEQSMAAL